MGMQEAGKGDRATHYALSVAVLKRKAEDVQHQMYALRLAEETLLEAVREEGAASLAKAEPRHGAGSAGPSRSKQARTWGAALAKAVAQQAREASEQAAREEPPFASTQLARESQQQAASTLKV